MNNKAPLRLRGKHRNGAPPGAAIAIHRQIDLRKSTLNGKLTAISVNRLLTPLIAIHDVFAEPMQALQELLTLPQTLVQELTKPKPSHQRP